MKCIVTKEKEGGYSMTVKNKTLVANMQHVKFKEIPPLKGPDSQGLNVPEKQVYNNKELGEYKWQIWTKLYQT